MEKILIIDDEASVREVLKDILSDEGYEVLEAPDGIEGLRIMKTEPVDLVFLDIWLPKMGGIDVLKIIKEEYPVISVLIISGHANVDLAVKAIKIGAFDFLEKPLDLTRVLTLSRNALELEKLKKENRSLKTARVPDDQMVGSSLGMLQIREIISQTADSEARVLILGDNGTGKELVARALHNSSSRRMEPFVEVNCAAIPENLIESELFGHEKGSFTGAARQKKGKFELADGGTLFLDEVADMSLAAQAKVLRAIQELKFDRIGGTDQISVDVRIISATNKDIMREIEEGRFREDLYFRLNVVPIHVPSLKNRVEDLPLLVDHFMKLFTPSGSPERRISVEGLAEMSRFPWTGNIRELKNFIERINIMSEEIEITAETVVEFLGEQKLTKKSPLLEKFGIMKLNEARDEFEQILLQDRLETNGYNISRTAQDLGIYPSNLHSKIKKYGLEIKK
ncbi:MULTISPECIES: sigma-54 dependent transcriptional regulator [unclassified Oceanispirochaeta]|uniref:sigma-54-dependent transcriptional regulator n=1 Tax=unclassified Oceanispirochaeta TaxID=2635722 RepID=UPI000E08D844|nr:MULTISPECIES: sigma-54 dependent transcriptional regulator [unclassified Oceanispirochaeta]MBF9015353.1 sigma-54-dependent Fis family transcriptional regulator [Oceanispirochaeta sp. M2]NPD71811.1 sigma-54-dependent Fis family transcriptional regulator [Oceanispirochaeta sp. M1]RDG33000.1 sigma-54-dependent Fis family transcriptional regulator [Oceanispirochaeta sp. M1]